jgi:hypothetical protein
LLSLRISRLRCQSACFGDFTRMVCVPTGTLASCRRVTNKLAIDIDVCPIWIGGDHDCTEPIWLGGRTVRYRQVGIEAVKNVQEVASKYLFLRTLITTTYVAVAGEDGEARILGKARIGEGKFAEEERRFAAGLNATRM